MVEAGYGPVLIGTVHGRLPVPHRLQVAVNEEGRVIVEELELPAPARHHDGVAVRGPVERAQAPPFAMGQGDVTIAACVQAGDA